MNTQNLLAEAKELQDTLLSIRRDLHQHPEIGFDLPYTFDLVWKQLCDMGYEPQKCGKSGIVALVGPSEGKCILLRADMDALPLQECADIDYKSTTDGKMHGCGHDMHTAMLLGAAKLLKIHEADLSGTVKLVFQPAEEIFQGSQDMISSGVLENPKVDVAVMIHVVPGVPMPAGMIMVPAGGISMASCEQYHITVTGKGGHGSTPHNSIDPITAAAHIHLALQEINSREIDANDFAVITTGHFEAGKTSNVIPDSADMWGTIRTTDEDYKVGTYVKKRMEEITASVATALRCNAKISFYDYCPCMNINGELAADAVCFTKEILGPGVLDMSLNPNNKPGGGSEDFAFMSHHVPTLGLFLTAGEIAKGYNFQQHNPQVVFDDSILYVGSAVYTQMALKWLNK